MTRPESPPNPGDTASVWAFGPSEARLLLVTSRTPRDSRLRLVRPRPQATARKAVTTRRTSAGAPAHPRAPRPRRNWPGRPGPCWPTPYGSPAGPRTAPRTGAAPARRRRPCERGRRRAGADPGSRCAPTGTGPGWPGSSSCTATPPAPAGGCAPGTATTPPCCAAGSPSSTPGRWPTPHPTASRPPPVAEVVEAVPQVLSLLQLSAGPVTVPALLDLLGQRVAELRTTSGARCRTARSRAARARRASGVRRR